MSALVYSLFWRRFGKAGLLGTLIGGSVAVLVLMSGTRLVSGSPASAFRPERTPQRPSCTRTVRRHRATDPRRTSAAPPELERQRLELRVFPGVENVAPTPSQV